MKKLLLLFSLLTLCVVSSNAQAPLVISQTWNPITPPPALGTSTITTSTVGGTFAAGTYRVCVTYISTNGGESLCSTDTSSTITTTGTTSTVTVIAPPSPVTGVAGAGPNIVGYRVYISAAGGAAGSELLQTMTSTTCTLSSSTTTSCALGSNYLGASLGAGAAVPANDGAFSPNVAPLSGIQEQNLGIGVHHVVWTVSGTVTSCTFTVDSSPDNVTYTSGGIMASQTCTASGSFTVYNVSANYVRVNMTALTSSNSTAVVTITYTGAPNALNSGPVFAQLFSTGAITPVATAAAIGVATQTFTVTGLNSGDQVYLVLLPTPTALCPAVAGRATAANTLSLDFAVLTAAACTPASGTYKFLAVR